MRNYIENVAYNFATQTICLIAGLISNIVIARLLGPEGKGIITLLSNYVSIAVIIFMLGMSESNVFYLSKGSFSQSDILSTDLFHLTFMTIVFLTFSLLLKNIFLTGFLKGINDYFFFMSLLYFPMQFLYLHLITILQGHKCLKDYSLSFLLRSLTLLILQLLFIPHWNISGGLVALILSTLTVNLINLSKLPRKNNKLCIINIDFLRKSVFFGIKSQIGLLLNFLDRRLDFFIINSFLNPIQVGYYSVAVIIAEIPWYFSNAVGVVLFPEITTKEKNQSYQLIAFICRNTIIITVGLIIIVILCANLFIRLIFGLKFVESIVPLQLLLPGVIGLAINRIICAGFSGTGRPELGTLTVVFSSVATIVFDFLLIPRLGIKGASLASTISYFISAVTGIILFRRISNLCFSDILLFKISDLKKYSQIIEKIKGIGKNE
ncbi:MAG: polysaccharide biosynthesis C-terminal domain-containing protein [bacterium]